MPNATVRSDNVWDTFCPRCGFDKRWPAHNCDHRPMTRLGREARRIMKLPLVLDGLYSPYSGRNK